MKLAPGIVTVRRAIAAVQRAIGSVSAPRDGRAVDTGRGWRSWWIGPGHQPEDWFQKDIKPSQEATMANWAVFACMRQIPSDVGKLGLNLVEFIPEHGIWEVARSSAFSPVLTKPNHFQTLQQFLECWLVSKLSAGNTYILKERDKSAIVRRLYVLDANRVKPLVVEGTGEVYYELGADNLSKVPEAERVVVPASEIIHDRWNCFFHPLVGIPPLWACWLAAAQGINIQENSARFFANMSRPSGLLTAPEEISDEVAQRLQREWNQNYGGNNVGKVAVLGDGLKYEAMSHTAEQSQTAEQLKLTAEMICTAFGMPPFKVGVGTLPQGMKAADINGIYLADCLQVLLEAVENLLDDGLGIGMANAKDGHIYGTEFNLDNLMKMDRKTQAEVLDIEFKAGMLAPDEGRQTLGRRKVAGGASPMVQQQNFSLAALAKRDAKEDPFGSAKPPASPPEPPAGNEEEDTETTTDDAKALVAGIVKRLSEARRAVR